MSQMWQAWCATMKAYFYCVSSGNKRASVLAPHSAVPTLMFQSAERQHHRNAATGWNTGTRLSGASPGNRGTKSVFYFLMYQLADLVSLCVSVGGGGGGADGKRCSSWWGQSCQSRRMEVIKMMCSYAGLAVGIGQNSPIEIRYRDRLLTSLSRFRWAGMWFQRWIMSGNQQGLSFYGASLWW